MVGSLRASDEGLVDQGVLSFIHAVSDEAEFLGPDGSGVGIAVDAEDEDQDWEDAADVGPNCENDIT